MSINKSGKKYRFLSECGATGASLSIFRFSFSILILFVLPATSLHGQVNLAFMRLGREDGLSQGQCPFITRDKEGFLWLSSQDGLNRYDGRSIKVYRPETEKPHTMVSNIVTSACFEDDVTGNLWFTTYNAIHCYVRAYDHFDTVQVFDRSKIRLTEDYYAFHLDINGGLWVRVGSGENGLLHIFNTQTGQDSIIGPIQGNRSTVILHKSGAVSKLVCTEFLPKDSILMQVIDIQQHTVKNYLKAADLRDRVHECWVENDTLIWMGAVGRMIAFNPESGRFSQYRLSPNDSLTDIWSVAGYQQKLLFVSTLNKGLWLFDRQKRTFIQQFTHQPDNPFSLPDNQISNMLIDQQDNLWLAHWGYGISQVNLRKNKFLVPELALGGTYWQIFKGPDGNIWCGDSGKDIYVYTPDGRFVDSISVTFPSIQTTIHFGNRLYWCRDQQTAFYGNLVLHWNAPKRQIEFIRKREQTFIGYCETPSGQLIGATLNDLFFIQQNHEKPDLITPVLLTSPVKIERIASVFCDPKGNLYISTNYEHLYIFKPAAAGYELVQHFKGAGDCKGFCPMPGQKGAWLASSAGLIRVDEQLNITLLNASTDHLPQATYYGVAMDGKGQLWLSSNQGILRYNPTKKTVQRFLRKDGLFGTEFNRNAFYQSESGMIWAGGMGGFVMFHPDTIRPVPFEPQVQLIRIMVNDLDWTGAQQPEKISLLDMPYHQNTLSFSFVALEFSDPAANVFKYRLVGYDDNWVDCGTNGFARYANLPPGHYTLEIMAANSDGVWSENPKRLPIHIQTPFYKTWWFYLICSAVLGGLIYFWIWYRLQQALKIERLRVQISSDLHDDVGTMLAGLAMQSEALALTANDKDKSRLQRISDISRQAMSHMRDTVWAIDARKDKLENLLDRMREHAEETLTPKDLRFVIETEGLSPKQHLPVNIRQNLYLIYKEAITNAAKHSNGYLVTIRLKKSATGLELTVHDNGQTAQKSYTTTGSGLSNMKMRAEKTGGTMTIYRENGFELVFFIPFAS